jgi:tripartite-type tricarboxylate transporter receptor subunit TctC
MEHLRSMTGVGHPARAVPRAARQAVAGLLGEQVDIVVDGAAMAQVKAGKLKGPRRHRPSAACAAEVPGIGETVKGFSFTNWWGVLVPPGTPPDAVKRLNAELVAIAAMPDVRDKLRDLGLNAQAAPRRHSAICCARNPRRLRAS